MWHNLVSYCSWDLYYLSLRLFSFCSLTCFTVFTEFLVYYLWTEHSNVFWVLMNQSLMKMCQILTERYFRGVILRKHVFELTYTSNYLSELLFGTFVVTLLVYYLNMLNWDLTKFFTVYYKNKKKSFYMSNTF